MTGHTTFNPAGRTSLERLVRSEKARQLEKWGEQNHPDGTSCGYTAMANMLRRQADSNADAGTLTWKDILLEEVYEALAETDRLALTTELVQVAAVAMSWAEAIARREVAA